MGYPTVGASGSLVVCYRLTAVNAGTQNYDIAVDFLNYLLGEEVQCERGPSTVRRDILTANVVEHPSFTDTPVFMFGKRGYMPLEGKPDGTSYLQEYVELLDTGTPATRWRGEIDSIVVEESGAFFAGDKSAEDAAKLIQNRVQLYLDERK